MEKMSRIGLDTSKRIFQLHGVDDAEQPSLRNKLPRDRMIAFFQALPLTVVAPAVVAREACGASHHGSRVLGAMGHTVKLIGPRLAQPYVKRGLTDAAEARCEAASRPTMRHVPVKTADQQAALMLVASRERLAQVQADTAAPALARAVFAGLFAGLAADHAPAEARLAAADAELHAWHETAWHKTAWHKTAWHETSVVAQHLTQIPGVGPVIASMLVVARPARLPLGTRLRRLARADGKRSLDCRQDAIGTDHPRRR